MHDLLSWCACPPQYCPLGGQFWVHGSSGLPTSTIIAFLMLFMAPGWVLCMPASIVDQNNATMTINYKQKLQIEVVFAPKDQFVCTFFWVLFARFWGGGSLLFLHYFWHVVIRIFITIWHHFRHLRHNPPKSRKFEEVSLLHDLTNNEQNNRSSKWI